MELLILTAVLGLGGLGVRFLTNTRSNVSSAVETGVTQTEARDPRNIAVMYFEDVFPEDGLRHLASGFTEQLIQQLQGVESLKVTSAFGVRPFRGGSVPPDSVARVLDVGSLVSGNIRKQGDSLRLFIELVDAPTGRTLASSVLVTEGGDLIAVQRDLVDEVAQQLRVRLGESIRLQEGRAGASNSEAWELVQRALETQSEADELVAAGGTNAWESSSALMLQAEGLLVEAASLDSQWAEPVVLRGSLALKLATTADAFGEQVSDAMHFARAQQLAERAAADYPRDASALELRGRVRWRATGERPTEDQVLFEQDAAIQHMRDAILADPDRASAHLQLSRMLRIRGYENEAAIHARAALERDAYLEEAIDVIYRLWVTYFFMGDHTNAAEWCAEGGARFPNSERFVQCELTDLAMNREAPADLSRAWSLYDRVIALDPPGVDPSRDAYNPIYRVALLAMVAARAELPDSARALVARARQMAGANDSFNDNLHRDEALVRLHLGEFELSVDLLRRHLDALPANRDNILQTARFAPLHDRADFQSLARF